MAVFSPDEDVFLFLSDQDGRLSPVEWFLGKYTVRRAPGDTEPYVRTWQTSAGVPFDARFLPHPALENRVYLSQLRQQVQDHLVRSWDGQAIPGISLDHLRQINTVERRAP